MTEVVHGPNPTFKHEIIRNKKYGLTMVGYYTTEDGWTAGGVTEFKYESDDDVNRQAELLGMRSIFIHWWIEQWVACGGDPRDGMLHIIGSFFGPTR